jgi:hypothetical protein
LSDYQSIEVRFMSNVRLPEILSVCEEIQDEFQTIVSESSPFEAKGIFNSELLMLCAIIKATNIELLVESGRARGQSTELISRFCANNNIEFHSVEYDQNSPDVQVAEARLSDLKQSVTLHYGNAFDIIPSIIDSNKQCAVLIDGPKKLYAIELAMKLLVNNERLVACMLHDVNKDAYPSRELLDKYFPDAIYSENIEFLEKYSFLDQECWRIQAQIPRFSGWAPYRRGRQKMQSYSSTLGYIAQSDEPGTYQKCLDEALNMQRYQNFLGGFQYKATKTIRKLRRII